VPKLKVNNVTLHYTDEGPGLPAKPETIVFSHGLLLNGSIFADQIKHLKSRYRCITYDHRGQGASELATDGFDIDNLTRDAAELIKAMDVGPCHFIGLSMGGFVGLRLAIKHPQLVKSLTLIDTSAEPDGAFKNFRYKLVNFIAKNFGLKIVVGQVMPFMFGKTFIKDPARKDELEKWRRVSLSNDPLTITRAVTGVINRTDIRDQLKRITCPTLILVGEEDITTPPEKSVTMHREIKGSKYQVIPRAGHIATVENPDAVNVAIDGFLGQV